MIITKLKGGLGNQMFQYAYGRYLSLKYNDNLLLDLTEFDTRPNDADYSYREFSLNAYKLNCQAASEQEISRFRLFPRNKRELLMGILYRKIFNYHIIIERKAQLLSGNEKNIYLNGYWQSEDYFREIRDVLLSDFALKEPLQNTASVWYSKIKAKKQSVALHIRRGDYVTNKNAFDLLGACSLEYYYSAVRLMQKGNADANFFVFSDDVLWVNENFKIDAPFEVVTTNEPATEIYLMSICQHNIIANSSFSWWGAWLNSHENKVVICPKNWYKQTQLDKPAITPEAWIKL